MKICVMPHLPYLSVPTRGWQMARALASLPDLECHFLVWGSPDVSVTSRLRRGVEKLYRALDNQRLRPPYSRDGVTIHQLPLLDPPLMTLGVPITWIQSHNRRRLEAALRRLGPDWLISGGIHAAPVPWALGVRTALDLFDDHFPGLSDLAQLRRIGAVAADTLERADLILGSSRTITEKYAAISGRPVVYVPNGFQAAPPLGSHRRAEARARLGVPEDARVVAYVGNHGPHAGISFLLDVISRLHQDDSRLFCAIGGPIFWRHERLRARSAPGTRAVGIIDSAQMPDFLAAADIGVLPTEMSEFRSHALPLKILEYGAHGLPVVASPLRELKLQGFPHVRLAPYGDLEAWVEAIKVALGTRWQPAWSEALEPFKWTRIAGDLVETLAGRGRPSAVVEAAVSNCRG
jgi:glycosyltransferase involved in cell wall biosynthesis